MYHYPNQQQLYHNNSFVSLEDVKVQNVETFSQAQYLQVLPQNEETNVQITNEYAVSGPEVTDGFKNKKNTSSKRKAKKVGSTEKVVKKPAVDTSNFSVEERLVAAVWVHERKHSSTSISEIKHKFRRRFGRDPPSKTTLFAWERKLFATGNVCDAPRTGRPVLRQQHVSAVVASCRATPRLSVRARARALRLPRSTLQSILTHDLPDLRTPAAPPDPPALPAARRERPVSPARGAGTQTLAQPGGVYPRDSLVTTI